MNILVVLAALAVVVNAEFVNSWKGSFQFSCRNRKQIVRISSEYKARQGDRRWEFSCGRVPGLPAKDTTCRSSGVVNDFGEDIDFTCPDGGFLNGVDSYYGMEEYDRRFKFRCCSFESSVMQNCELKWANGVTEPVDFEVPEGYVLAGISSKYNSEARDREFGFKYCQLQEQLGKRMSGWAEWASWG